MNPEERVMRARLGAHSVHAKYSGSYLTEKARQTFASSFERQVLAAAAERGERLSQGEVARRAEHLRKAHYTRLSMKGVAARAKGQPKASPRDAHTDQTPSPKGVSDERTRKH